MMVVGKLGSQAEIAANHGFVPTLIIILLVDLRDRLAFFLLRQQPAL